MVAYKISGEDKWTHFSTPKSFEKRFRKFIEVKNRWI